MSKSTKGTPPKNNLQSLYESALWYGYTMYKGVRYTDMRLSMIASEKGVKLEYIPAI